MIFARLGHISTAPEEEGFTLLEVIAVLTIIALIASVTLPRSFFFNPQSALKLAAINTTARLKTIRSTALQTNSPRWVFIDRQRRVLYDPKSETSFPFPLGITIDLDGYDSATFGSKSAIVFYEDGSSSGGYLIIRTEAKQQCHVAINPISGTMSLEDCL